MEASRPIAIGQAKQCGTPEYDQHEAVQNAITERGDEMVHALADMPAVTREGMQAKARAILLWDRGQRTQGRAGRLLRGSTDGVAAAGSAGREGGA